MSDWETMLEEARSSEQRAWDLKRQATETRCPYKLGYEGPEQCVLDTDHSGDHVAPKPMWVMR